MMMILRQEETVECLSCLCCKVSCSGRMAGMKNVRRR